MIAIGKHISPPPLKPIQVAGDVRSTIQGLKNRRDQTTNPKVRDGLTRIINSLEKQQGQGGGGGGAVREA